MPLFRNCLLLEYQYHDAINDVFSEKANKKAWVQVGAVPFTKKCLDDPKVRHDWMDEQDPLFDTFQDVQLQNDFAVIQLNMMGYNSDSLLVQFC
jgi:hypothetical protein